jgi:hypothetical protein
MSSQHRNNVSKPNPAAKVTPRRSHQNVREASCSAPEDLPHVRRQVWIGSWQICTHLTVRSRRAGMLREFEMLLSGDEAQRRNG